MTPPARLPDNEQERLAALQRLEVLDSATEPGFEVLVRAASLVCGTPISLISMIDADRQWFKANVGLPEVAETPRDVAFCAHALLGDELFEVPDATQDPRFAQNPLVTGSPDIRFYAGIPLTLSDGHRVGTLCVMDRVARELNDTQREVLRCLGVAAAKALEMRRTATEEARYRVLTDMSPLGVYASNAKGAFTYTNARWQQIHDLQAVRALDDGWTDAIHPADRARVTEQWQRSGRLQSEFNQEFRVRRSDGSVRTVRSRARPVLDEFGRTQSYVGNVEDITEGRALLDRLVASETRVRSLYQATPALLHSTDSDGVLLTVSDRWLETLGYEPHEVLGKPSLSFFTEASRQHAQSIGQPLLRAEGRVNRLPYQVLTQAGQVLDVEWSALLEQDAQGEILRVMAVMEDVTERRKAERELQRSQELLQQTNQLAGVGGWEYEIVSGELVWDARMFELYGVSAEHNTASEAWSTHVHPGDRAESEARLAEAIAGGRPFDIEFRIRRADGSERSIRSAAHVTRDPDGKPQRMTGVNWDVTEAKQLQQEVDRQRELLAVTLQSIADAVITTDASGNVQWMNPVAERMTGWNSAEAQGRPLQQVFVIVNQETRLPAENPVATCLKEGQVVGLANHTLLISRDGMEHGIEDSATPIRSGSGEVLGVVLVFHDVTEQRRLSGEMSYRATHDDLTGLFNRGEFETRLGRVLQQSHDDRSAHALLYIDLDQFKLVNDACGHSAGDQLLKQFSKLLADTLRSRDILARLGGDEFAAILEYCTEQHALSVAQKICDRMEVYRFEHDGKRFRVGASIGLVPVDARWSGKAAILQAADTCCYAAKEAGRNRVQVWLDTDHALRERHGEMQWTTRIEQALDEDRFELFGQRIVPLGAQEPGLHAEVLLRLRDPDGSLIPPGAFMPAAERFHLMTRIDRWVLKAVLAWLHLHAEQVHRLSMNLSGQSLGDRAFHRQAVEQLSALPASTLSRLCLEITETAAITNLADAGLFIEQVRALGVQVALDDFGAGMSSFGYLKSLPVNTLKIDGQFVKGLLGDALDHAAVRSFVEVARLVNMDTVAEFVETQAIHDELRRLGVTHAQGYLLHRPEPLEALLRSA